MPDLWQGLVKGKTMDALKLADEIDAIVSGGIVPSRATLERVTATLREQAAENERRSKVQIILGNSLQRASYNLIDLQQQLAAAIERLRTHKLLTNEDPMAHPDFIGDVRLFHLAMGLGVSDYPHMPPPKVRYLRNHLNHEELGELDQAVVQEDLAGIVDAIGDLIYVLCGMAITYGLPLAEVWYEIQRANMSKLWTKEEVLAMLRTTKEEALTTGSSQYEGWQYQPCGLSKQELHQAFGQDAERFVVHDEKGKVRKPPSWTPPNIARLVAAAKQRAGYAISTQGQEISEEEMAKSMGFVIPGSNPPIPDLARFYSWRSEFDPSILPNDPYDPPEPGNQDPSLSPARHYPTHPEPDAG